MGNPITERVTITPNYTILPIAWALAVVVWLQCPGFLAALACIILALVSNWVALLPYQERFYDPGDRLGHLFLLMVQGIFGVVVGFVVWGIGHLFFDNPFDNLFLGGVSLAFLCPWTMEFTLYRERI